MILLWAGLAAAEIAPPDYATTLREGAGKEVSRLGVEASPDAAEAFAKRWMRTFGESARVTYELGLVWRLAGDDAHARKYLDQAVVLDPDLAAARYDRGEVRLAGGDLAGALEDFTAVSRLEPEAWPGWFRLADLAGRRGDARTFEADFVQALRFGFQVGAVAKDPTWQGYLDDPTIGPVYTRLVRVYQGEAALEELRSGGEGEGSGAPADAGASPPAR